MSDKDLEPRHLETLDRDLGRFANLEAAAAYVSRPLVAPGIGFVFIILAGLAAAILLGQSGEMLIVDGLQRVRAGQPVQGTPAPPRPARGG